MNGQKAQTHDSTSRHAGTNTDRMSSEGYEQKIDHTRKELNETLHKLENRLNPKEVWDRSTDAWGESLKDFSGSFSTMVRENPIPLAMMGVSLVWLMASSGSSGRSGSSGNGSGRTEQFKEKARGAAESVKETYEDMKDRAAEAAEDLGESISHMTDNVKHRGEMLRDKGGQWRGSVRQKSGSLADSPMLLAAAGAAFGALVAFSLPVTSKEEEVLGSKADEILEKAKEMGRDKLEQGKKAAAAAGEAAKEELSGEKAAGDKQHGQTS